MARTNTNAATGTVASYNGTRNVPNLPQANSGLGATLLPLAKVAAWQPVAYVPNAARCVLAAQAQAKGLRGAAAQAACSAPTPGEAARYLLLHTYYPGAKAVATLHAQPGKLAQAVATCRMAGGSWGKVAARYGLTEASVRSAFTAATGTPQAATGVGAWAGARAAQAKPVAKRTPRAAKPVAKPRASKRALAVAKAQAPSAANPALAAAHVAAKAQAPAS